MMCAFCDRAFSGDNPLVRCHSNVSISAEAGNAFFIPLPKGKRTEDDVYKSYRTPFAFPNQSEEKLAPLSGPNEGNITPRLFMDPLHVPSKAPRLSPLAQEPDTDHESRTDQTGTSSRITPSIDHGLIYDEDDEAECEDARTLPALPPPHAAELDVGPAGLNVEATSFVPTPQPQPMMAQYGFQQMPRSMVGPPGLAMNRGINHRPQHSMVSHQHPHPRPVPANTMGMMRNLNIPPVHIAQIAPRNPGHVVQGSPGGSIHSQHHTPVGQANGAPNNLNMGYPQCVGSLSPAPITNSHGFASAATAVPSKHSLSPQPPVNVMQGQGFQPHPVHGHGHGHRPSQSPPRTPAQAPQGVNGFSPHSVQPQSAYRPYNGSRTTRVAAPAPAKKVVVDVPHMIREGASLPQLLKQGLVIQFMKHQNGSRYIQERLSGAPSSLITAILKWIIFEQKGILSLSEDIFGNYVVQIFFEQHVARNDAESRKWVEWLIKYLLRGNALRLSRHVYGCRVIQRAFDCIAEVESIKLIEEIKEHGRMIGESGRTLMEECITCHHGNHVIQKIITLGLPIAHIQFVVDIVAGNIPLYSQHQYGCRIVQNIINLYGYEGNKRVLREVVKRDNLLKLCKSQYGNYVIQHVLKLNEYSHRDEYDEHGRLKLKGWQHCPQQYRNDKCLSIKSQVIETVFGSVETLSMNKYGSNVVEKCLNRASDEQTDLLLDEILCTQLRGNGKGGSKMRVDSGVLLTQMANHQFANYILQNIIQECKGQQQQRMIDAINEHIPNLRALKYGKHILEKINRVQHGHGKNRYY